jgi:rSAM/selenodomain-associated transferase 2
MVSVVIPVLDEEARLPACLDRVLPQAARIGAEVLVVDGGSRDGSVDLVRERPGARLLRGERGRGRQMNLGAREARGSLLVFLPADTLLPEGALQRLSEADRVGSPVAGGFRLRFDRRRLLLRWVAALSDLRARWTGVFYGDQVPFVRREVFLSLGGFREDLQVEDLEFATRLRRVVRPRLLPLTVTTSARRFDRSGDVRTTADSVRMLLSWLLFRRVPRVNRFSAPVR